MVAALRLSPLFALTWAVCHRAHAANLRFDAIARRDALRRSTAEQDDNLPPEITEYCAAPLSGSEGKLENEAAEQGLRLAHVQIVFRHGLRTVQDHHEFPNQTDRHMQSCAMQGRLKTITDHWPNLFVLDSAKQHHLDTSKCDQTPLRSTLLPMTEEDGATCTYGQLTSVGTGQMVDFGEYLASAYDSQLNVRGLPPSDIEVTSTDVPRTQASAASVLSGMFGDLMAAEQRWPYPIVAQSIFLRPECRRACPRLDELETSIKKSVGDTCYSTRSEVAQLFPGWNNSDLGAGDQVLANACHEHEPLCGSGGCINPDLEKQIVLAAGKEWCYWNADGDAAKMTKLQAQPNLKNILERLLNENGDRRKLVLWSGHDTTVAPIASALGFYNSDNCGWPPIRSRIVFELWTSSQDEASNQGEVVRVLYNGKVVTPDICGCGGAELCPLSAFASTVHNLTAPFGSWSEACSAHV